MSLLSVRSAPAPAWNGYGRQRQSFEADVVLGSGDVPPLPSVFIRAPRIESVGDRVEILAALDGVPVLVRSGGVLASVFHPELTPDRRLHRFFAEMCTSDGTKIVDLIDALEGPEALT
jgi:5'-phosphate synthase pdxT subunit